MLLCLPLLLCVPLPGLAGLMLLKSQTLSGDSQCCIPSTVPRAEPGALCVPTHGPVVTFSPPSALLSAPVGVSGTTSAFTPLTYIERQSVL